MPEADMLPRDLVNKRLPVLVGLFARLPAPSAKNPFSKVGVSVFYMWLYKASSELGELGFKIRRPVVHQ